ncbi:Uncharacterized conserved protein [Providencia rettgeri]|uniref:Uncharacterized conserved protein n=1 Tax=Providencia rettgeri TaxID=587 RepID=A0A379FVX0_PRORE|nr:Uncharacterized conserved protein [Providencia rettgeri]
MKIVVTGAKGFIGKNLCIMLKEAGYSNIIEVDRNTTRSDLTSILSEADFVYHLAGINRTKSEYDFIEGNIDLTYFITEQLAALNRKVPLVFSSSTQALQK